MTRLSTRSSSANLPPCPSECFVFLLAFFFLWFSWGSPSRDGVEPRSVAACARYIAWVPPLLQCSESPSFSSSPLTLTAARVAEDSDTVTRILLRLFTTELLLNVIYTIYFVPVYR